MSAAESRRRGRPTPAGAGKTREAAAARTRNTDRESAPFARPHEIDPTDPGARERPATIVLVALVLLLVVRLAVLPLPNMALWGLNVGRFLAPWALVLALLPMALALVPALARRGLPAFQRAGDALAGARSARIVALLAAAALVLAIPDRAWYVGDFLLRQGAVEQHIGAASVFPQALPLDRLLHNEIPNRLGRVTSFDPGLPGRVIGAIDAMILAWGAIAFARALELRGAVLAAVAAAVFFGGYLAVFTGYSKAVVELCALAPAIAAGGIRMLRGTGGALTLGAAFAIAIAAHRSALAWAPAVAFAWLARARAAAPDARPAHTPESRAAWLAGLALPLVALAVTLPRAIRTFREVDVPIHVQPHAVREGGGILATAFAGLRALDMANVVLLLCPLVLALPAAAWVRRVRGDGREGAFLGLLVLPLLLAMPLIHPAQGMFRDWDNFVALGSSLAVLAAWVIARALEPARVRRWVAVAVASSALSCALAWMLHHRDVDRGLTRMRAFVDEPPPRSEAERVAALDYIGIRNIRLMRNAESAAAFRAASDLVPNPRFLIQWGIAANEAKDYVSGREAYARLIQRTPRDPLAWRGWTSMSARLGDFDAARSGARKILELVPGDPDATWLLEHADEIEASVREPGTAVPPGLAVPPPPGAAVPPRR